MTMDFDKPPAFASNSERTQWYKQKKQLRRKHQQELSKKKQHKLQQHIVKDASNIMGYSERHQRRIRKAIDAEERRIKARERKRKERLRKNMATQEAADGQITKFSHRMEKKRAIEKLQDALPCAPIKRCATVAAYLDHHKSPTVQCLKAQNIVTSLKERKDNELGTQVLDNLYDAISRSKIKLSDEKRVEMHTIIASVSGENISQSKAKTNLAKRLGVSVRRISGGQRLRGKVLTSSKSCWFYTKKKTRSDKISDENKKLIYEFWMSPGISRPTGNKTGPKCYLSHPIHILEKTQTDVYEEFLQTHPSCTISQRAFEKLKPFFVKPVRPKDKTACCCRYHIECNHAFKKCMQFRKMTYTNSEQLNGGYPVFERSADMIARTLCEQPGKACLDRKCVECGVPQYLFSPNEMDESEQAPEIEWERYEYQTVKSKSNVLNRKLILVKKTTKVGSLFKHMLELLKS
ncbi:hypothetical protein MAR_021103 [Mya arenaria]|uniref:Uncharacterized protein n=1 Tax=Mya arenaria TaxID=6604 RepID=A0ABY7EBE1_MYAAR|nr:hypothetical protein MAR_021103 [Mya arenaria]